MSGSPAARGPAGPHFEGQVGASYLVALLLGTDVRGLPGITPERVAFQRDGEGHALDDIVVHGHDARGTAATLEVQVKRSMDFAPGDAEFRDVVAQVARSSDNPNFDSTRYELAVATAHSSRNIDRSYQAVLAWAREIGDAAIFAEKIRRPKTANKEMRTFVETFQANLKACGAAHDDAAAWRLLRRFQIHIYDFASEGSICELWSADRIARVLPPDEQSRASDLWSHLVEQAISIAKVSGDRTADALRNQLAAENYRLAGERRYRSARARLAEASKHALAHISDDVAGAKLTRLERIQELHQAIAESRLIEIRGDGGVGKSGVLKHLANELQAQANLMLLTPERTPPRGWANMAHQIGFTGTARNLLVDFASEGAAFLLIDNLDRFEVEVQTTVSDLIREAAQVPGITVVVTCRNSFGREQPSWLPRDGIAALGTPATIAVKEASDEELEELAAQAPVVARVLATRASAREVTRNLFRLSRLVSAGNPGEQIRTEADMALHWWKTGDSAPEATERARARAIKKLAAQALAAGPVLNAVVLDEDIIDELVKAGTLTDLGEDRVSFRHDVFGEWAVGCLLNAEPTELERLPLGSMASGTLARGVEIAARLAIERQQEATLWSSLLERLTAPGAHESWRQAVLLALVRSESALHALTKAALPLLKERGDALRQLVRLVMAVEVERVSSLYARAGLEAPAGLHEVNVPTSPVWSRLIYWLLLLDAGLPKPAIPDVADLYGKWALAMASWGSEHFVARIATWLFTWLMEIDQHREQEWTPDARALFDGEIDSEELKTLESNLRPVCAHLAKFAPGEARAYLRFMGKARRADAATKSILRNAAGFAEAAPDELAAFTLKVLVARPRRSRRYEDDVQGFSMEDLEFMPPSPAQGPFFALLRHAPATGLKLINSLVSFAIKNHVGDRQPQPDDSFPIDMGEDRIVNYPWIRSYRFSRDGNSYAVTSALMALEAWGHTRMEAGEDVGPVLADVCPEGSPAAFVLPAVDILISHWPKTARACVPYVTCPELLALERQRQLMDSVEGPDFFGLMALRKEQRGPVATRDLKARQSRRWSLERLIDIVALGSDVDLRAQIGARVRVAVKRLGPPAPSDTLAQPALMAQHMLNRLDRANWREKPATGEDGTNVLFEYVPPEEERRHFAALTKEHAVHTEETQMQLAIAARLEDASRTDATFAASAVDWAMNSTAEEAPEKDSLRKEAIVSAAMFAMRDGAPPLMQRAAKWSKETLDAALAEEEDHIHRVRGGIRFNRPAIAFLGLVHGFAAAAPGFGIGDLLRAAASSAAAGHAFSQAIPVLSQKDERLVRALLRTALSACVGPGRAWGIDPAEQEARSHEHSQKLAKAIDAEVSWLKGAGDEPGWPILPMQVRVRRNTLITGQRSSARIPIEREVEDRFDHQRASIWLAQTQVLAAPTPPTWLVDVLRTTSNWTANANGVGMGPETSINEPDNWNSAYFELLARSISVLSAEEVEVLCIRPVVALPDESFFDLIASFARSIDQAYFGDALIPAPVALTLREAYASRLRSTSGWSRIRGNKSGGVEMHIGPAIASLLFNTYIYGQLPKTYLLPPAAARLQPLLPIAQQLAMEGASYFVAAATLSLLEVAPEIVDRQALMSVAIAWLEAYPDDVRFWVETGYGQRVCALIDKTSNRVGAGGKAEVLQDRLLTRLVGLGVAEAGHLQRKLAAVR